ncbi:hypothetical protein [Streptomyces sp. NPDC127112]|uniref:hypothetical protein n=1 Tax=Streptomyces sp. NPDC127112 TaxID=3345364 RepID=UPI00362928A5
MSPALGVIVYPPDAEGGRRIRVDGEILGRATGLADIFEFLRQPGLDPADVDLADALFIEWRGGGPAVWTSDAGEQWQGGGELSRRRGRSGTRQAAGVASRTRGKNRGLRRGPR